LKRLKKRRQMPKLSLISRIRKKLDTKRSLSIKRKLKQEKRYSMLRIIKILLKLRKKLLRSIKRLR